MNNKIMAHAKNPSYFQKIGDMVDRALGLTLEKSQCYDVDALKEQLGRGSYDHTNFRFFLAHEIVQCLILMNQQPLRAWIYDFDVTEADPSACDSSGDGSPCDWAMGTEIKMLALVWGIVACQQELTLVLGAMLERVLADRGVKVVEKYLQLKFITQEDINLKKEEACRVTSLYYPAQEIIFN